MTRLSITVRCFAAVGTGAASVCATTASMGAVISRGVSSASAMRREPIEASLPNRAAGVLGFDDLPHVPQPPVDEPADHWTYAAPGDRTDPSAGYDDHLSPHEATAVRAERHHRELALAADHAAGVQHFAPTTAVVVALPARDRHRVEEPDATDAGPGMEAPTERGGVIDGLHPGLRHPLAL